MAQANRVTGVMMRKSLDQVTSYIQGQEALLKSRAAIAAATGNSIAGHSAAIEGNKSPVAVPPVQFRIAEYSLKFKCIACEGLMSNMKHDRPLRILVGDVQAPWHVECFFEQQLRGIYKNETGEEATVPD